MTKPAPTRPVVTLPANTQGRDFVVGDIHGIFDILDDALKAVNFDPARDRLLSVGDLVDRGPQSHKVLHYLAQPWFHAIRGNHEQMFLHAMRTGTLDQEVVERNLQHGFGWMRQQTPEHLLAIKAAFEKLPVAIQIESATGKPEDRIGLVHADVPAGMSWPTFVRELEAGTHKVTQIAQWSRRRVDDRDDSGVAGIARVFFGHTPQVGVTQLGNCYFVDTGGVFRFANSPRSILYFLMLAETTAPDDALRNPVRSAKGHMIALKTPLPPAPATKPRFTFKPPRP